jgi:DNA-binding response OmpR family regulator
MRLSVGSLNIAMETKAHQRLLIVDDEPSVLLTYRMLLEHQGYEVVAASSSEEAEASLRESQFDAVLCDLSLERDRSGFDVFRVAREKYQSVPCILLTGYANREVAERAEQNGVQVLYKPIEVEELLKTIELSLRNAHGNQAKANGD